MKSNYRIAGEQRQKGKREPEPSFLKYRSRKQCHRADRRKVPRMRQNPQRRGQHHQNGSESRFHPQHLLFVHFVLHARTSSSGNKSQNTKESRSTTSPVLHRTGLRKMGPSYTNE